MPGSKRISGAPALSIVGRVFLALGVVALAAAAMFATTEFYGRRTARAEGTVASINGRHPWVRFKTPDGRSELFRGEVKSTSWRVGDRTAVAFDPQQPSGAAIDGIGGRWFFAFLFAVIGGGFAAIGVGLMIGARFGSRRRG